MKSIFRAAVLTFMMGAASIAAQAQVRIFFGIGAPAPILAPSYVPPCPGPGYIWAPGYYYGQVWIPGRWVDRDDYYRGWGWGRDYDYDHHDWDHRGHGWGHYDHGHGWGHRH